ncbi:hypothetical protein BCV70DRAFT_117152 [Testicularia cyperi]|uniref:Uncharacterized protein n=1 Tax=Testicularia cyperi TaxID=1882483 RepID=A0A317XPY0_9BASI|nr:hypothetical protein BCV70DRAFT_117152 [Testicularia cyperi]
MTTSSASPKRDRENTMAMFLTVFDMGVRLHSLLLVNLLFGALFQEFSLVTGSPTPTPSPLPLPLPWPLNRLQIPPPSDGRFTIPGSGYAEYCNQGPSRLAKPGWVCGYLVHAADWDAISTTQYVYWSVDRRAFAMRCLSDDLGNPIPDAISLLDGTNVLQTGGTFSPSTGDASCCHLYFGRWFAKSDWCPSDPPVAVRI